MIHPYLQHEKDTELGAGGPQERDWRGIGTALLVIMIICTLIGLAVFLFTPLTATTSQYHRELNLSDLSSLRPSYHSLEWIGNDQLYFESVPEGVMSLDIKTGDIEKLIDKDTMSQQPQYIPSKDLNYFALLNKAPNPSLNIMNNSFYINIFNRKSQMMYKVGVGQTEEETQKLFYWNPSGNDYVFAQDGHIYYSSSPESREAIRVSKSGEGLTVHGVFDWVYDEEIFMTRMEIGPQRYAAIWWAPKGDLLAFASRDSKLDPKQTITMTSYDRESNYPVVSQLQYPKTGEKRLPSYTISIWDKKSRKLKIMDVQLRDSSSFHYLYGVGWVTLQGKQEFVTVWANRFQNQISITLCDFETALCTLIFEHKYPAKTWAQPEDYKDMIYSDDSIYVLLPKNKPDGNSYQQIARLQIQEDESKPNVRWAKASFVSSGNFDVKSMVKYDAATDTIYFMAHAPSPGSIHLYATRGSTTTSDAWRCLTCNMPNCSYQVAKVAPDFKNVMIACKGPGLPKFYVGRLNNTNHHAALEVTNRRQILIEEELEKRYEDTALPLVVEESVQLSNGFVARAQLVIPSDQLSKAQHRSLPVLVKVYGGPGSQSVIDQFVAGFEEYLITTKQIAVLKIDGRGSGARGWKYKSQMYGALGTVEIQDQIEATRLLVNKYPYLDASRIAIFGWSYGGFSAVNMVETAPDGFFKCAISVAPVSNFRYYDATYTERYMGNAGRAAYDQADLARDVHKFKNTRLLLMHGLFDDNVHFQNSAHFMDELQAKVIDFDLMVYPNQDHSMSPRRSFINQKMETFLQKCYAH